MVHSGASGLRVCQACWLPLQAPCGKICPPAGGGQLLLPSRLIQKGSSKPTAHPYSPSSQCPPLLVSPRLSHPHTCVLPLFLCRCPKTASADTLTLWAGLSCAGRTCSWAGLTHPPQRSQSIQASSVHSSKPTEWEWRKALTTDTSANGSETQVPRADENPALPLVIPTMAHRLAVSGNSRWHTHPRCLMTNTLPPPKLLSPVSSLPALFLSWVR